MVYILGGGLVVRGVNGERAAVESWQCACTGGVCAHIYIYIYTCVYVCVHLQLGVGEVWGFGGVVESEHKCLQEAEFCVAKCTWFSYEHASGI